MRAHAGLPPSVRMTAISELTVAPDRTAPTDTGDAIRRRWECVCGQSYRISGVDRHRIYWPSEAPSDAPVLDGCCVRCRRPLPGKHAHCLECL
jgi:hypothetical protein